MKKRSQLLRIVTNSERNFFACQRRWWFRYVEGLTTSRTPAPLKAGSLWHQCLAAFYRAMRQGQVLNADDIHGLVIVPWLEKRMEFLDGQRTSHAMTSSPEDVEADEDEDMAALTWGMLGGYIEQWKDDAEHWEILHVEAQAARAITISKQVTDQTGTYRVKRGMKDRVKFADSSAPRTWVYGGAVDLLVRDRSTGLVWLVEHKTAGSSVNLRNYMGKLHWDPQIRGYGWMLADPIPQGDIREPYRVEGVIYNVARKKIPREPKLLEGAVKRLERRKDIDTTAEVFRQTCIKHGLDPDGYADQLEMLAQRGQTFFARETYFFTDPELKAFEREVVAHAQDIKRAERAEFHPMQTAMCVGGIVHTPCPYSGICLADGPMARKSYTVQTIRHAELTGDLAEPYVGKLRGVTDLASSAVQQNAGPAEPVSVEADPFSDVDEGTWQANG